MEGKRSVQRNCPQDIRYNLPNQLQKSFLGDMLHKGMCWRFPHMCRQDTGDMKCLTQRSFLEDMEYMQEILARIPILKGN
jgi:hypothetical protein